MMFSGRRCQAISKKTGKPCRQPAVEGTELCRMHGAPEATAAGAEDCGELPVPAEEGVRGSARPGAPERNHNARLHGGYSARLLPEEQPIYEEKMAAFSAALGAMDTFDRELVHLLSLISTKVDQAVMRGADHAAYAGMVKQILDLLRELKATRASRDTVAQSQCLTFADLFDALRRHHAEAGAEDFLGNYQVQLLGDVSTELAGGIQRTITQGVLTGKSIPEVARDIGRVVQDPEAFRTAGKTVFKTAQQRASLIARTETLRAHNEGRTVFYRQVGVTQVQWITAHDERTCPVCRPLEGKVFGIDEIPESHPGCRCSRLALRP